MAKNTQPIAKRCKALGISPAVMGYAKKNTTRNSGTGGDGGDSGNNGGDNSGDDGNGGNSSGDNSGDDQSNGAQ